MINNVDSCHDGTLVEDKKKYKMKCPKNLMNKNGAQCSGAGFKDSGCTAFVFIMTS